MMSDLEQCLVEILSQTERTNELLQNISAERSIIRDIIRNCLLAARLQHKIDYPGVLLRIADILRISVSWEDYALTEPPTLQPLLTELHANIGKCQTIPEALRIIETVAAREEMREPA